ncbi:glycosyltransferase [Gillisia marina]|uniref:glycosyltransferase n=1 Tax=Gillisia marina TaxID=1167637 RepID=UPI00031C146E|nr:glycosyltransferase [Gillisia marina]
MELLIDAIELIKNRNLKINIAGEGDQKYLEHLKNLILKKGLTTNFNFLGGVYNQEKWKIYKESDLFVLPTYSENFGIVIIEALAARVPVITTTGTPWEELQTNKCGWWIKPNAEALAKAIQKAMNSSPAQLKSMGIRGRALVERKYDIQKVALMMQDFYQDVMDIENSTELITELKKNYG